MLVALDLGTSTGYAARLQHGARISGVWLFKPQRHENWAMRFARFRECLHVLHVIEDVEYCFYEEVRSHKGTDAAHVYGGFLTTLHDWCNPQGVALAGVSVGTIKKFATGKGNASKAMMIDAAYERWGVPAVDDNEADAVALREYALAEILKIE